VIEFREAEKEDFKNVCGLVKSKDELFWVYPHGQFPLTASQLEKLSKERKELTVAVDKEKIIGFANLYNYDKGNSAFIGNVIIDEEYRGKEIGRSLVLYMLEKVYKKHGLNEVHISVFNNNTTALLLYSSLGFNPYAIEERRNPSGLRVALIHMKAKTNKNKT